MLPLLSALLTCVPPDCDRPDFGTCGNACCSLLVHFPNTSSVALMQALNSTLAQGGPDGRFHLMSTFETAPYPGFADLRPYHPEQVSFLGQAWHATCADTYVPGPPCCFLRAVRTGGAGQLAPGPHARYVRTTRASPGRAVRTAYRVVHHRHATQKLTLNDTLNLLILKESNKATLRAFSTSQIGGA